MTLLDASPLPRTRPFDHHGSHTHLYDPVEADAQSSVGIDAVIVPAARATESLQTAIGLADELGAVCLALCSKSADAAEAVSIGRRIGADVVAVQTSALPTSSPADPDERERSRVLPDFRSSEILDPAGHGGNVDIAFKRNLGLVLARLSSWNRIFFLDDDVVNVPAQHVKSAAALLNDYDAVGLQNCGFPDNSVVCHANRRVFPGSQEQFISTMALTLTIGAEAFFPDIYNEDWFFFLGELPANQSKPRLAATGKAVQKEFDPFADPERARREEFGDTIAEGLFWLLDQDRPLEDADIRYWESYLNVRRAFIERVLARTRSSTPDDSEARARVAALEAAKQQNESFTPEFCAAYVDAWRADLRTWQSFIAGLGTPAATISGAIEKLGLSTYTHTSR